MLNRPFDALNEADVQALVAAGAIEDRTLELKELLPGGSDDDTREFLADVTSLGNTSGGDLIFGVTDPKKGSPSAKGVSPPDVDAAILRLENLVRDCVQPRLAVRTTAIPLAAGGHVVVVRVPASLAGPHRYNFRSTRRFYARNSRGKYEMDVDELRSAFVSSEALPSRLRALHTGAVARADGLEMPFAVGPGPRVVCSVAPVDVLRERRDLQFRQDHVARPPRLSGAFDEFLSLEGTITRSPVDECRVRTYSLNHRAGWIEAAWIIGRQLSSEEHRGLGADETRVWLAYFETEGVELFVRRAVKVLSEHNVEGPWIVQLTLLGLQGATMVVGDDYSVGPAWKSQATLPELMFDGEAPDLTPLYQNFWLLFGSKRP